VANARDQDEVWIKCIIAMMHHDGFDIKAMGYKPKSLSQACLDPKGIRKPTKEELSLDHKLLEQDQLKQYFAAEGKKLADAEATAMANSLVPTADMDYQEMILN